MGFDAKAFATAFLEGQAVDIKARLQEAREEGKRKAEIARTAGMSQWKKRKGVANAYKLYVDYLDNAGMSQENLRYLIQSPKSLVEAYKGIKNFSDTHRGEKLDEETINSIVDLSSTFVDEKGPDGKPLYSLDQLIKRMAGLYKENHNTTSTDPMSKYENLLASALSLNADERYNIKMKSQMVGDNFNMLDLYDMGAAGDFVPESIAPVDVNIGLIPQPLTDREMAKQQDDFFGQLEILIRQEQDDLVAKGQALPTDKQKLLNNLQSGLQIDSTRMRLSEMYGDKAIKNLYAKGGFYKNIFDNPLVWDAENRARMEAEILGREKLGTTSGDAGGQQDNVKAKFNTEEELKNAIINESIGKNDIIELAGNRVVVNDEMIMEANKADSDAIESQIRGGGVQKVSTVSTESLQSIFNNALVEKKDYGMGAVFEIATLPELSPEEKRVTDAYIASLKEAYDRLPTELRGGYGGTMDRKVYKGKTYGTGTEEDFKRFLRVRLKEEFPDVADSLIQELVGMY